MSARRLLQLLTITFTLGLASSPAWSQGAPAEVKETSLTAETQEASTGPVICPDSGKLLEDLIMERIQDSKQGEMPPLDGAFMVNLAAQRPKTSPDSKQAQAPAGVSSALSLVNGAGFPELLRFAMDSGLLSEKDDVITANLNLFDWKAAFQPEVLDKQSLYQQSERLRRWGASATFGGTGESFDRNGDGQADEALKAKELGDIVNWEVRYRLYGTRDRRDLTNVNKFKASKGQGLFGEIHQALTDLLTAAERDQILDEKTDCVRLIALETVLASPEKARAIALIREKLPTLLSEIDTLNADIDGSWIVTAVVGGLDRRDQFGPDKRMAALRIAKGIAKDQGLTFNAEYSETRGLKDLEPTTLKFALEYGLLSLKGSQLAGKDGMKVAISGSYETFDDVPGVDFDTTAKLGAQFDFPLTDKIKIPVSVTWANHKELIKEDEIRGHIGFSIDLSKLEEFLKP